MAGKHDGFQLLEFQPKTVYLPENGGTAGTFRRPGSAEDRGEAEYARIPRRSYNEYDGTGPRERIIPLHETHLVDNMKQPLLNHNNAPVYLLVPADSANLAASQRYVGGGTAAGVAMMDGHGIRRRPTYVHERVDVDSYRREKSCCSCWKCMIALIVILTIIGLGLAITGIVFIKLIHQDNQSAVNGTEPRRSIPSQRSALSDGSPDFDLAPTRVSSDNETINGTEKFDILVSGLGNNFTTSRPDANNAQPTDSSTLTEIKLSVPENADTVEFTVKVVNTTREANATEAEVDPLAAQVFGVYNEEAYRQDPDAVHPLVALAFDKDSDYDFDFNTTAAPEKVFTSAMAFAFHHTQSPDFVPIIQNLTNVVNATLTHQQQRALADAQRTLEAARQKGILEMRFDLDRNASGTTTTLGPLP